MILLGLDPGRTTGWAKVLLTDRTLEFQGFGQTRDMTLVELIDEIRNADFVVYEGWRTRPDKAQKGDFNWQTVPAEQVIGSLLTLAKLHQKPVHEQQASQKPIGYGWAGLNYKKGAKGRHKEDALAHVVYYAVKHLKAFPLGVK